MRVYVWKHLAQVSSSYHPDGGLLICAEDEAHARVLATAHGDIEIPESFSPDLVFEVDNQIDSLVMVFPDAGCC